MPRLARGSDLTPLRIFEYLIKQETEEEKLRSLGYFLKTNLTEMLVEKFSEESRTVSRSEAWKRLFQEIRQTYRGRIAVALTRSDAEHAIEENVLKKWNEGSNAHARLAVTCYFWMHTRLAAEASYSATQVDRGTLGASFEIVFGQIVPTDSATAQLLQDDYDKRRDVSPIRKFEHAKAAPPSIEGANLAHDIQFDIKVSTGHRSKYGEICRIRFMNNGKRIVSISAFGDACIWDGKSLRLIKRLKKTKLDLNNFNLHPYERKISCFRSKIGTWVWDTRILHYRNNDDEEFEEVLRDGDDDPIYHRTISINNERQLLKFDRGVSLLTISLDKSIANFDSHEGDTECAVFSDDGSQILTASNLGTISIWDGYSGDVVKESSFRIDSGFRRAIFFDNDSKIVSVSGDNYIRVWDIVSGAVVWKKKFKEKIEEIDCHKSKICLGFQDGSIVLLSLRRVKM